MGNKWRQDPREGGLTIQQRETRRGTMGNKWRQDPREGGLTIQQRATRRGTIWETKETRPSERRTHHPTKGNKKGHNGKQRRQDPREGGLTIQQRETRRGTMGNKGDKTLGKADSPSNKGKQEGAQWETKETRPSGRRTHHPTKGNKKGHNGKQRRQDPREGGLTIQQRETRRGTIWETKETRPSGRRTHHPTKGNKKWHNGKQRETRPSGRRTHRPTKGNKKGHNGKQRRQDPREGGLTIQQRATRRGTIWETKETRPSGRRTHHPTKGNKKGHNGKQRRQNPREGGLTIQQRATRRGTMGNKGDKTLGKADSPSNKGQQEGAQWETTETRHSERRTHHPTKGNKKGHNGKQRRQDPREGGLTIQQRETRRGTMGNKGDKTLGKADSPSNKGQQEGAQWETKETRPSGRRTHHPTKGNKKGHNGKQRRQDPREGGLTIQQRATRRGTMGNKGDKTLGKADSPSNKGQQEGAQWETKETRPSGRRTHHPTKGNKKGHNGKQRRQDPREGGLTIQQRETRRGTMGNKGDKTLGKADSPSNKGKQEGAQWETKETRPSGRRTHHPTKGNKKGHNGKQRRQDPREGGLTIQQRETRRGTMGNKGDKTLGKADSPSNKGQQEGHNGKQRRQDPREGGLIIQQRATRRGTMGNNGDKTLGKADSPSNKGKQEGAQWETKETRPSERRTHHPTKGNKKGHNGKQRRQDPREGGLTIQQRETRRGTMGNKGDKTLGKADSPSNKGKQEGAQWETKETRPSGRRTHHPTKGNKKGHNGELRRQDPREGGLTIQQRETRRGTMGNKGDKTLGKADSPSNKGQQEGAQWETKETRPSGRRTHHPTKGNKKGYNGRQRETRPSGRRTHHPTKGNKKGYNGRQGETRPSESGHTIQQKAKNETKGRQDPREGGHTIHQRKTRRGTMGDKGRQNPREGGHTIQQRETRRGTMGDKRRQASGRRTHHPTKGNKKGHNGRQMGDKTLGKADTPSNKGKQEAVQWETKGDKTHRKANSPSNKGKQERVQWETKGDKTLGKADSPSNKGQQEAVQWETKGDKTLGRADSPSNKGQQEGAQWETKETRPSGRRTHHPTMGNKMGYNGRKGRQDPPEGGHTIQQRETRRGTRETRGDKTLGKADTPSNTKADTLRKH